MNTPISTPAGTARPLLSGGYAIDFGDPTPVIVPDREHALRELAARTPPAAPAQP